MSADSSVIANMANKIEEDEKEVVLTGNAAEALQGGGRGRRRRGTSKRGKRGGGDSGALIQLSAQSLQRGGDNSGALVGLAAQGEANSYTPMSADQTYKEYAAAYQTASAHLPLLRSTAQRGGNTGAVVNLASTRSVVTPGSQAPVPTVSGQPIGGPAPALIGGVFLKPKKGKVSLKAPRKMKIAPTGATRKAPRKIKLGVKGLKTRLNRAKKAHSHAQTVSLALVKQRLVKAGVIKSSSKAPEHMLRTMYADLLVTKKGL